MNGHPEALRRVGGAQSIRRAIKVLRVLAVGREQGVRLADIVAESGLSRPTVHRILRVLAEEGVVEQHAETRRYLVGHEVSLLGLARGGRFPLRAIAEPYLRYLSEQAGDTVFLTIRSRFDSICLERRTGSYPVQVLALEVGGRRPLGVGVAGVMLLACLPEDEAATIAKSNEKRFAPYQLSSARLLERVRAARAKGYAFTEVGIVRGTRAVAVPVLDGSGEALAAISIAAIADRIGPSRLGLLVTMMKGQAELISRRLAELERSGQRGR